MSESDFSASVRFGFQVCCDPDGDYCEYVVDIEGIIIADIEPEDASQEVEEVEIGRLRAFVIQSTQAQNDRVSLLEVCDAHSGDLEAMFAAIFNVETEEPRDELGVEPLWDGLLYLDQIEVEPEFRESGVVIKALESAIRSFCPSGIIAAHRSGMELTTEEWRELGFVKIAGSEIIFRDNASVNPYKRSSEEQE